MESRINPSECAASSSSFTTHCPEAEINTPNTLIPPLSYSQSKQLYRLKRDRTSFFSSVPLDIINEIVKVHYDSNRESLIGILLQQIIYADEECIDLVKEMLDKTPELLLWASDVEDRAKNLIRRVTPYQLSLMSGDDYLANIIAPYFDKLGEPGRLVKAAHDSECNTHIDTILNEPTYDYTSLINAFKHASLESVQKALACEFDEEKYLLHAAIAQFRDNFSPRTITEGMLFNYKNLIEAFKKYISLPFTLNANSRITESKCDLFWRQIVGYIQRSLPSCDLQAFAQGTSELIDSNEPACRRFTLRTTEKSNSSNNHNSVFDGLGYFYALGGDSNNPKNFYWGTTAHFSDLCEIKKSNLKKLCNAHSVNLSARASI